MRELTSKWLFRIGSFVLAGLLLWLALRNVDLEEVVSILSVAHYSWLVPLAIITLTSHWVRAVRWKLFLEALPSSNTRSKPISTVNTFLSIMIGNMANYAGPRIGEVIRVGNVAQREKISFSAVLGTVFAERLFDLVTFGLALLTVPIIFSQQMAALWKVLVTPTFDLLQKVSLTWWVVGVIAFIVVSYGGIILFLRASKKTDSRLAKFLHHFKDGVLSLFKSDQRKQIAGLTVLMWLCYGFMAYIPFVLLGQNGVYQIGPVEAWGIMLIGVLGVIIPSPGGLGTFHFVTIQSLGLLFAMPGADAAAYAIISHAGQMLFYILIGTMGILYLGNIGPKVKKTSKHGLVEND